MLGAIHRTFKVGWLAAYVVLIPGTGVVFTVAVGLAQGRRAGFFAAVGCTLGIVPPLLASVQAWLRRGLAGAFAVLGTQLAVSER